MKIETWLEFDFSRLIEVITDSNDEKRHKSKLSKKMLSSPTRALRSLTPETSYWSKKDKDGNVVLNSACVWGSDIGNCIDDVIIKGETNPKDENMEKALGNYFSLLKSLNITPIACEKHVLDDKQHIFHGFVDVIGKRGDNELVLIENKSRNHEGMKEVGVKPWFQVSVYESIARSQLDDDIKITPLVILIDRTTGDVVAHKYDTSDYFHAVDLLKAIKSFNSYL